MNDLRPTETPAASAAGVFPSDEMLPLGWRQRWICGISPDPDEPIGHDGFGAPIYPHQIRVHWSDPAPMTRESLLEWHLAGDLLGAQIRAEERLTARRLGLSIDGRQFCQRQIPEMGQE